MRQWRKYEHTLRIKHSDYVVKGKRNLTDKEIKYLLGTSVVVTEKMDGSNTGIFKKKDQMFLQKRSGLADGSHMQFKRWTNEWRWQNDEKLQLIPNNVVVYGELMYCVHTIFYNKLPDWWLVFDVFDLETKKYWSWENLIELCSRCGLKHVPFIFEGIVTKNDIPQIMPIKSAYGDRAEGIVVKNYKRQIRGKIVHPEFYKDPSFNDYWAKRPIVYNEVIKKREEG